MCQAVHSSWDVGCCLPVSATPLPFFFLIPQNHLQLVKNDPLKLVNVFHSFPLTSHSCDRRCPSGVGTAPLPRGGVAMVVPTSGLGLSCLFSPALPPQELHLAGTWQQKLLTKRLEKLLRLMLSILKGFQGVEVSSKPTFTLYRETLRHKKRKVIPLDGEGNKDWSWSVLLLLWVPHVISRVFCWLPMRFAEQKNYLLWETFYLVLSPT